VLLRMALFLLTVNSLQQRALIEW
ncbi:hypothetical protein D029_0047B, partial [Vibrio parahaemolyticus 970107]